VESADHAAREKEFTGKQIHLDFAPLPPTIVDDAIHPDWRGFRRPRRIDITRRFVGVGVVSEFDMAYLMGDQEGLLKRGTRRFVEDEPILGDERRPAIVKDWRTARGRLDINVAAIGFRNRKGIGVPGVAAIGNRLVVEIGCNLPGKLDPIHFNRPPLVPPAFLRKR
jgi:hypothetical protein